MGILYHPRSDNDMLIVIICIFRPSINYALQYFTKFIKFSNQGLLRFRVLTVDPLKLSVRLFCLYNTKQLEVGRISINTTDSW